MNVCVCVGVCVCGRGRGRGRVCWAHLQRSPSQMLAVTWLSLHGCFDLCSVRKSLIVVIDVSLRSESKRFPYVKAFVAYPFLGIVFHTLCSFFC